jgi:hypothetical protein
MKFLFNLFFIFLLCKNKNNNNNNLFVNAIRYPHFLEYSILAKNQTRDLLVTATLSKAAGVYTPIDYKKNPQSYCGMTINDNPLYDL